VFDSDNVSLLKLAETAARKAADFLISRQCDGQKDVISSDGRDIKLKSDQKSETIIINHLRSHTSIPILSEETGAHGDAQNADQIWIVDPLDGSLNFNRGIPLTCVSIALWRNGMPSLGVVYDFIRDESFIADVAKGAWLNGKPIHVSAVTEPASGILATGIPSNADVDTEAIIMFAGNLSKFKKTRMLGSAALMLSWVSCGRVDAYQEKEIMLWDVAAGLALVKAAGGWIHYESGSNPWQCRVRAGAAMSLFQ